MSFWAEDPELFLHKGQDGIVHVLRCKKEAATSSSSSMLMKPEDFTDEGAVTDLRTLTDGRYNWDKNKYEALIDYIYPKHLLVNCHGSVIVELESDEKSVLALLFNLFFLLFKWLLVNLFHINKKADAVVYMRALDILDMGCYGPGLDHPGQAVPVRTIKYLQDGTIVQTKPTPNEMKLSKEVEALQQELLLAKEKIEVELARDLKLTEELAMENKEVETLQQELLEAKEKTAAEVAKEMELTKELAIESKELKTSEQELSLAKEKIGSEIAKEMNLTEELARKSKEVETSQQLLAKEKTEMDVLTKRVAELELEMKLMAPLPVVRIYSKAAGNCSLTIRNGHVILGSNNNNDVYQYWVKDDKYGEVVKDKWDHPSYALVNKHTAQALKPINASNPLELVPYYRNSLDRSILWTDDVQGDGSKAIRKATDPGLNLDASSNGSVIGDGDNVGLWTWWGGDNQKWYIATCND